VLPPADPVQLTPELAAALAGIEVEVAPIPSVQRKFRKKGTPIEVFYEGAWVPAELCNKVAGSLAGTKGAAITGG